jgi:hypothetical protein
VCRAQAASLRGDADALEALLADVAQTDGTPVAGVRALTLQAATSKPASSAPTPAASSATSSPPVKDLDKSSKAQSFWGTFENKTASAPSEEGVPSSDVSTDAGRSCV